MSDTITKALQGRFTLSRSDKCLEHVDVKIAIESHRGMSVRMSLVSVVRMDMGRLFHMVCQNL